ncbi:MAG: 4Fe-4S binding protein [Thermoleophilia bacterium]
MYVDENLCSGCAICVDVCAQGAISLKGTVAVIDEARCTSCSRCVDECPTGAIIDAEVVTERSLSPAPAPYPQALLVRSGAASLSPAAAWPEAIVPAAAHAVSRPAATSKLEVAQKVLSGLLGVLNFALDRRQGRSSGSALLKVLARNGTAITGGRSNTCPYGGQSRPRGQGRGSGTGLGGGRGRNNRRRNNRRDRST